MNSSIWGQVNNSWRQVHPNVTREISHSVNSKLWASFVEKAETNSISTIIGAKIYDQKPVLDTRP